LYRAALEGATFSLVAGLDRLRELTGNDDNDTATSSTFSHNKELLLVGGGSRNTLWRRIICDAFQLPLKFPVEPDSAALGAAYQAAAVGKGIPVAEFIESHARPAMEGEVMQPDESVAGEYREAYERFKKWGGDMFGGRSADL
jgi:xylulokinase